MKFKNLIYKKLGKTICGDEGPGLYLSGPMLVDFFGELGFDDKYDRGFPTRYMYAEEKAKTLIENNKFNELINELLAPIRYLDAEGTPIQVMNYINSFLEIESYKIIELKNGKYSIAKINGSAVSVSKEELNVLSSEFLNEQVDKCNRKISEKDFYGAITNARSMVEEVLLSIEKEITGQRGENNGDMSKLYKRVSKLISFDAGKQGLATPLKQILSGLNSIVIGVASLRTKASDSHAPEYKPDKHHAVLAVNCAMTFTSFIIGSYNYQRSKSE